jgi:acid phosphatase (class A)
MPTHRMTSAGTSVSSAPRGALAVLWLTCATAAPAARPATAGYLDPGVALHIEAWLPGAPADDSMAKAADVETFFHTRALIGTARAEEAHADDVPPAEPLKVAPRFTYLLGISVSADNAPRFLRLMSQVRSDAEQLLAPVKKSVGSGGRHRPFVEYPQLPHCEITYAGLADSGSYPSGHATLGWLWGALLAEIVPQYADQLLARGIAFGDSRVVCGFHYPSDVAAGRLAAAALLARLHADPAFLKDLAAARREITALLAARGSAGH